MPPPPRSSFAPLAAMLAAGIALGWFGGMKSASWPAVTPSAVAQAAGTRAPSTPANAPVPSTDAAQAFDDALTAPVTDYQRRSLLERGANDLDRAEVVAALERERTRLPLNGPDRILPPPRS